MKSKSKILLSLILSICFVCLFSFVASADTQHYTITYKEDKKNMYTLNPSDVSLTSHYDEELGQEVFILTSEVPNIVGYRFIGWKIGDSNEVLLGGKKIKATGNLTVVAQFMIGSCKVRYEGSHKEDFEEEVTTGRDYRIREPGCHYGRTFQYYQMYINGSYQGTVQSRKVINVTQNIVLRAVWTPYSAIFAKDLLIVPSPGSLVEDQTTSFLRTSNDTKDDTGGPTITASFTDNVNEAITDIRLFEGASYSGSDNVTFDGKVYKLAKYNNQIYNIRSVSGFGGEPLYIGYTCDSGSNEKIMGYSILSKSYYNVSRSLKNIAYHNIVKDQNGNEKNMLDGTTHNGSSNFGGRKNYIVYDKYDINKFIAESDIFYVGVGNDTHTYDWMKKIPDDYYVTEINIPGSHDTGAMKAHHLVTRPGTRTQNEAVYRQFICGCRYVDCRPYYTRNTLLNVHGICDLLYDAGETKSLDKSIGRNVSDDRTKYQTFEDMLYWAVKFVTDYPSETILFSIQCEGRDSEYLETTRNLIRSYIEDAMYGYSALGSYYEGEPGRIWIENRVPTMKEARGKVVILNSWWHSTVPYKNIGYGVDFTNWWGQYPRSSDFYSFVNDGGDHDSEFVIEFNVKPYFNAVESISGDYVKMMQREDYAFIKRKYIYELASTSGFKRLFYFFNTQVRNGGATGKPEKWYGRIHQEFTNHTFIPGVYYGIVAFDFYKTDPMYKIYISNFGYFGWGKSFGL